MRNIQLGQSTLIMGILNITPDSFSDGGLFVDPRKAISRVAQMLEEGADIIDVGGESTRPNSESISVKEEIKRVVPVIKDIRRKFPNSIISIDSYKKGVVKEAFLEGANMVNSLGGFSSDPTLPLVIEKDTPILIYHIKGKPKDMQKKDPVYNDVIGDVKKFFEKQISFGMSKGLKREQFIIDPGIGFGKTVEQNLEIIKRLNEFRSLKLPICVGVSRKSHLGTLLKKELKLSIVPEALDRLEGSLAETAVAVINGTKIVRTHDVFQTKKFLTVLDKVK
jgi:dihydropteroate synthase